MKEIIINEKRAMIINTLKSDDFIRGNYGKTDIEYLRRRDIIEYNNKKYSLSTIGMKIFYIIEERKKENEDE